MLANAIADYVGVSRGELKELASDGAISSDIIKAAVFNMADDVEKAYDAMIDNLNAAHKGQLEGISNAYNAEDRLNNLRNYLRDAEIEEIESNRKNYQTSVYYMDVVSELEKMGDFIINISQNLEKVFVKK